MFSDADVVSSSAIDFRSRPFSRGVGGSKDRAEARSPTESVVDWSEGGGKSPAAQPPAAFLSPSAGSWYCNEDRRPTKAMKAGKSRVGPRVVEAFAEPPVGEGGGATTDLNR